MQQNTRRTQRSARSQRSRPYNTYVRREDFARIPGVFDEEVHLLRSPKNSLIARAFSVFGTLLALIFILNILRFKNTLYYFGNQPLHFNGEGETLVRWQFTVSVALYSVVFFVSSLILIAQLCCAESWAASRAFLLFFHFVFIVGNFLPPIFIIAWLASENSPSRYDHTRPGPTATGLCIASVIFGFLASGLMLIRKGLSVLEPGVP